MVELRDLLNKTYRVSQAPIPRPQSAIDADHVAGRKQDRRLVFEHRQRMDHMARIERAAAKKRAARKNRPAK